MDFSVVNIYTYNACIYLCLYHARIVHNCNALTRKWLSQFVKIAINGRSIGNVTTCMFIYVHHSSNYKYTVNITKFDFVFSVPIATEC